MRVSYTPADTNLLESGEDSAEKLAEAETARVSLSAQDLSECFPARSSANSEGTSFREAEGRRKRNERLI